jgi:predicted aspartyl protease
VKGWWLPWTLLALAIASPAFAQEKKACQLVRYSEIPITTLPDGRFTVPVIVEGRKLDFLVDTGGAVATLEENEAFSMRIPFQYTASGLQGVAGSLLPYVAKVRNFSLGGMQGTNLDIFKDPRLPDGADGTLSPDMLKHFDVEIDFVRGKLGLFSQKHCPGQVVYWTKIGYYALPMELVSNGHIQVPVTLDGVKLNALLDTGARHSIISMRAVRALGISEKSPELKPGTDDDARYKVYDYPFKALDFGGISVNKPRIQVVSDNFLPGRIDMLIGISMLRRLHLYIDYGEEKLYLTLAGDN